MPGFKIYWGDPRNLDDIRQVLETFNKPWPPQQLIDGQEVCLLDKVNNFRVRTDGVILFTFQWDEIQIYDYQGVSQGQVVTRYVHVRIIPQDPMFFLFEKPKHKFGYAVMEISKLMYGTPRAISRPDLSSTIIKDLESRDSSSIHGETFERVSDRDHAVSLYGSLEVRGEDGNVDYSTLHEQYMGRDKGSTQFMSRSIGKRIYISGKQGTCTVRGEGIRPEDAEFYICSQLLPLLISAKEFEGVDPDELTDEDTNSP